MANTTDTYVKAGSKWELQSYHSHSDDEASRSPRTDGTASGNYPRKANYFWSVAMEIYNSRRSGYGSGDANLFLRIWACQNNQTDVGGTDSNFSWRELDMNSSDHGDEANKQVSGFQFGNTSTSSAQIFCHTANGQNWEDSNENTNVHNPLFIFHVMRSGADDGSANAPDIYKVIGTTTSNYNVGAGFVVNNGWSASQKGNQNSRSINISPPTPPIYTYPNFVNGTIYEESGTGKHYMFDGTSTWNEMT